MAASLSTRIGILKADAKSKPTQPDARLPASERPRRADQSRISERNRLVLPSHGQLGDRFNHLAGGHFRPRLGFPRLRLPGGEHLYFGSPQVDHQDFWGKAETSGLSGGC